MLPDDWGFGISVDGTKKAGSACDIETQEYIFRMITASSKFGRYSGRLDFAGAVGGVDREMGCEIMDIGYSAWRMGDTDCTYVHVPSCTNSTWHYPKTKKTDMIVPSINKHWIRSGYGWKYPYWGIVNSSYQ